MLGKIMNHLSGIIRAWPLTWELAKTQFKLRYAGSILGYLWAILQPLLLFLVLLFVFSHIFERSVPHYSLHLITGIIIWTYFAEGTRVGLQAFVSNASLLKNVALPRHTLLLAAIVNVTITFGINLFILASFYVWQGVLPSAFSLLYFVGLSLLLGAFVLGVGLLIAPLYVIFRDVAQIWEVVLMLGFYSAPIIFSVELIPAKLQPLLWLNPVGYFIHFQREALLANHYAPPSVFLFLIGVTAGVVLLGSFVYSRLQASVVDHL